jgi:hypothetical protein
MGPQNTVRGNPILGPDFFVRCPTKNILRQLEKSRPGTLAAVILQQKINHSYE